jgi:hypothetical protein
MATLKQYGVLVVGLLMAGGFAFGGMASYSQMINTGSPSDDSVEASLPSQNFKDGSYNLSVRERMFLTLQEDAVFVSAIYNTTEQKQQLMKLQNLTESFRGRAYISVVSADESQTVNSLSITQYPAVWVYGYKFSAREGRPSPLPVQGELTDQNIGSRMCSSMNNWNDVRAYCAGI